MAFDYPVVCAEFHKAEKQGLVFSEDRKILLRCTKQFIRKVVIPSGVTHIADHVFSHCNMLKQCIIPESVTHIGHHAFSFTNLETIDLPKSITEIGNSAFRCCMRIKNLNLPDNVLCIGDGAFCGCTSLENLLIPENTVKIGTQAFRNCNIKHLYIPDAVTEIGDGAFFKIPSIEVAPGNSSFYTDQTGTLIDKSKKKVLWVPPNFKGRYIFSDDVCDIGEFAFAECDRLTAVVLPVSMKKIKEGTFWGCNRLNNLLLPDGITEIQQDAFAFCAIKNIILPETVQKIGDYAFAWCKLESITIPASVRVIGESAFGGNENLQNVTFQHQRFQVGKFKFLKIAGNAFSAAPCEEQLKRNFKQVFE